MAGGLAYAPPIPADEEARLRAVRALAILDTAPEESFDDLTRLAAAICGTPISTVTIIDRDRQWFKSVIGLDSNEDPRDVSFCAHTVVDKEQLVVPDATQDARFEENPLVLGDPNIRFYAGSPLVMGDGHVVGTICVIDRVPRRLTQDQASALDALARQTMRVLELRVSEQELQELDRVKDEFVAIVSHELRTPLASIRGYLEMVMDDETGEVNETQRRFLEIIEKNSKRLGNIIDDLLTIASARAGRLSLDRERVEVGAVAADVVESASPMAAAKGLTLTLDLADGLVVDADRSRLHQVLLNLVSNGVKFTPTGGNVKIQGRREGQWVAIHVTDTGPGIPASDIPFLFGRFFRTEAAEADGVPGTGLGLAISRAIAEAHDGELYVESSSPEGTTFRLLLPAP